MAVQSDVLFPLRPTLIVVAGGSDYQARSLGALAAQSYGEDLRRLTARFSRPARQMVISEAGEPDLVENVWGGLEASAMAIICGYKGTAEELSRLHAVIQAANPVSTLLNLGRDLEESAVGLFSKSVSLLPDSLPAQFALAHQVIKSARHENSWGRYEAFKEGRVLPAGRPLQAH